MTDYNNLGFDFWYEAANAVTSTAGKWIPARYGEAAVNASLDISLSFEPTAEVCKPALAKYAEAVKLADEGSALITADQHEEGIAKLSAALAIFPLDGKFLLLRGQAYLDTSKLAEACTDLRLARYITLVDWYDSIIALCK
jgi:tetratricopeptide (TPR) repeat protein